jgi:hypothetical protein
MPIWAPTLHNARELRATLLVIAAICAAVALLFARPHPTPGPPMRDFEAYYAAGTVWNAGGEPYSQTIWNAERGLAGVNGSRYEALPFVGPPALLPFFGSIARLPFTVANTLWRAALLAALAALVFATFHFCKRPVQAWTLLAFAITAAAFGPITSALALGQLALPAFAFAVLALGTPPFGILAWLQPNVALALLGQLFGRKSALGYAAGAGAFAALCAIAVQPPGLLHYFAVLHAHAQAERFSAIQITPGAIAYGLGGSAAFAAVLSTAIAVAAIAYWFVLMRALQGWLERFCATAVLLPFAMPFFHDTICSSSSCRPSCSRRGLAERRGRLPLSVRPSLRRIGLVWRSAPTARCKRFYSLPHSRARCSPCTNVRACV